MSQRETASKPFVISAIHGVNDRFVATELPLSDFSLVEGVFPQYEGMQTRIFGKRLLAKYADPIYGIYQFWSPVGYATGLYQFEGKLDSGPWLTPTSNIVIPALPAAVGFDGGGMSLDDFGNYYGGPVGIPNVCIIGFVGQNSADVQCGVVPEAVGTPNDDNGGPAGQGKTCSWTEGSVDVDVNLYIFQKLRATDGAYTLRVDVSNAGNPIFGCNSYPPLPVPINGNVSFTSYPSVTISGAIQSQQFLTSTWTFVPDWTIPGCDGTVSTFQFASITINDRIRFNFAALQNENFFPFRISMLATKSEGSVEIPLPVNYAALDADVNIDMLTYRGTGTQSPFDSGRGFQRLDFVTVSQLRIYYRQRVCS